MKALATGLALGIAVLSSVASAAVGPQEIRYDAGTLRTLDIYTPNQIEPSAQYPILVMVHGGRWTAGDKRQPALIEQSIRHWVDEQGWILASINYPLIPDVDVSEQVASVTRAVKMLQTRGREFGGDGQRIAVIGHGAGAHLVAVAGSRAADQPLQPTWQASVLLDSDALDLVSTMTAPHDPTYDVAFGREPNQWTALSPLHTTRRPTVPTLVVCSLADPRRCDETDRFVTHLVAQGTGASYMSSPLFGDELLAELGRPTPLMDIINTFFNDIQLRVNDNEED